jgi:hypothetical protein
MPSSTALVRLARLSSTAAPTDNMTGIAAMPNISATLPRF